MERKNDMLLQVPQDVQLIISRELNAPRSLVFEMFSNAEHLAKWWGPKGADITVKAFDFTPGGQFLYSMPAFDGTTWWGKFVYQDIKAHELITFISSFADEDGNIIRAPFSPDFPMQIYNHMEFIDAGNKTIINMKGAPAHASQNELGFFRNMHENMEQGFTGTFAKLEEYIAGIQG
jgi:uncharacterized protein YndB with AHSA1/START domain